MSAFLLVWLRTSRTIPGRMSALAAYQPRLGPILNQRQQTVGRILKAY